MIYSMINVIIVILLTEWSAMRWVLPEHVHTAFTFVDNVHFIEKIIPDLSGPGL